MTEIELLKLELEKARKRAEIAESALEEKSKYSERIQHSIIGYNQKALIENNISINLKELLVLGKLEQMCDAPGLKKKKFKNTTYTWCDQSKLYEIFPWIIKNTPSGRVAINRIFQSLEKEDLIQKEVRQYKNKNGKTTWVAVTDKARKLKNSYNQWKEENGIREERDLF